MEVFADVRVVTILQHIKVLNEHFVYLAQWFMSIIAQYKLHIIKFYVSATSKKKILL